MSVHVQNSRMTTSKLRQMKANGEKIAMLTSYDFTLASLVDEAGIDMILHRGPSTRHPGFSGDASGKDPACQ